MTSRFVILILFVFLARSGYSQTTVNPDISAIGDFQLFSHGDESQTETYKELNFADPSFEFMVNGYLNPYSRADVVIAWHEGHNAAIEEIFATFMRGLPFDANLRVGKYLLEFGRLNSVHPHAYSFIKRPLPHAMLLGEEGLSDYAIRAAFLLPTGAAYTQFIGGILKGDAFEGHAHAEEAEATEEEAHADDEDHYKNPGWFTRLATSLATGEASELALGSTVLNSVREVHQEEDNIEQLRSWLIGGDIKYKYRPSRYTSLQIESELIARINKQEEGIDDLTSWGAYGYFDYRFEQRYNVGTIYEWVRAEELEHDELTETHSIHKHTISRFGLFFGFAPVEETSLVRLAGHWTDPEEGDGFWEATLQLVISLGPHKPHNF